MYYMYDAVPPQIYFNLNYHDSRTAIINAMSLPYLSGGTTNTAEALRVLKEQMFSSSNGITQESDQIQKCPFFLKTSARCHVFDTPQETTVAALMLPSS